MSEDISVFVEAKRLVANFMLIVFLLTAAYSFITWISSVQDGGGSVSRVIFSDFFTSLYWHLILLVSYWFYTDFGNLARNTGFVLSTVIIRVAISSEGLGDGPIHLSGLLGIAILRMFAPDSALRVRKPRITTFQHIPHPFDMGGEYDWNETGYNILNGDGNYAKIQHLWIGSTPSHDTGWSADGDSGPGFLWLHRLPDRPVPDTLRNLTDDLRGCFSGIPS